MLVKVDERATPGERAQVREALDADATRPLAAGWRAYELDERVTLGEARGRLAGSDAAERVQLDSRMHTLAAPSDPYYPLQWPLQRIGAEAGWAAAAGAAPVTVAVVDTGVDLSHPDLAGRLWANPGELPGNGVDDDANGLVDDVNGWNFADGDRHLFASAQEDDHGTHVAGTIGAVRDNAAGVAGVADNARIMPLKFIKGDSGYTSDAIAAILYAIENDARVINASWGGGAHSPALCDAIELAGLHGVLFVVAAGNKGADNDATPTWPANCPSGSLVSVAATTDADGLASFSNRGVTQVDLGAPGNAVLSTAPGGAYAYRSGTSMAAPHVSGIAAALVGLHADLAPWQVKAAITAGGTPLPALVGTTASGRRASLTGALQAGGQGVGPDATAPDDFALLEPSAGLVTTDPRPVFRWTPTSDAQSGLAGYHLVVDGATVAGLGPGTTSARPASALPEGARSWWVLALDQQGNARATPPRPLVLDRTPPSAPVLQAPAPGGPVPGAGVDLRWAAAHDAVTGVAAYRVVVDGAAVATLGASQRALRVSLAPGDHLWRVVAVDGAGNQASSASRALRVTGRLRVTRPIVVPPIALRAPRLVVAGRRPVLRVRLAKAARVTFSVSRPGRRALARFSRRLRAGTTRVRMPASAARRMSRPGRYVVKARVAGGRTDVVRLKVRPRRAR